MPDNNTGCPNNSGNNQAPPATGSTQPDIFECVSPEEIVLLASIIAISVASELSDDNATSLAFFLSNIASSIGLFVDRRGRERGERIPVIPGLG